MPCQLLNAQEAWDWRREDKVRVESAPTNLVGATACCWPQKALESAQEMPSSENKTLDS